MKGLRTRAPKKRYEAFVSGHENPFQGLTRHGPGEFPSGKRWMASPGYLGINLQRVEGRKAQKHQVEQLLKAADENEL